MTGAALFLLICTGLCFYCVGVSWLLQIVCYPMYALVGEGDFVPFHVSFGRRLIPVGVVPMVITCLATFVLVFVRPEAAPAWAAVATAISSAIILGTTIFLEVPKHMQLDRDGKSAALINGLIRDNLPRTVAWTISSFLLGYMSLVTFSA